MFKVIFNDTSYTLNDIVKNIVRDINFLKKVNFEILIEDFFKYYESFSNKTEISRYEQALIYSKILLLKTNLSIVFLNQKSNKNKQYNTKEIIQKLIDFENSEIIKSELLVHNQKSSRMHFGNSFIANFKEELSKALVDENKTSTELILSKTTFLGAAEKVLDLEKIMKIKNLRTKIVSNRISLSKKNQEISQFILNKKNQIIDLKSLMFKDYSLTNFATTFLVLLKISANQKIFLNQKSYNNINVKIK